MSQEQSAKIYYFKQPRGESMAQDKTPPKTPKTSTPVVSNTQRSVGEPPRTRPRPELPAELASLQDKEAAQRRETPEKSRHKKALGKSRDLTVEDFLKFIRGEMTLAQLEGISRETLYEFAEIGYTFFKSGKYDDAASIFEGLVVYNPYDGYFHCALGAVYQKQKRFDDAIRQYNLAIKFNPRDICSYTNRGETFLLIGRLKEAAEDFQKAIELDPQEKDAWALRARALVIAVHNALKKNP